MKRLVVVVVLVVCLLVPVAAAALPLPCEVAVETGKLVDWLWCGFVLVAMGLLGDCSGYPCGWD